MESGLWSSYIFDVNVYTKDGKLIGRDTIGDSIHERPEDFIDHREAARVNRELRAKGITGVAVSYFSDMVREAIKDARRNYNKPRIFLRHV